MRIGFIEDTHLHGGTQIWVAEAAQAFLARGAEVTLLSPGDSWVAKQTEGTGARIVGYDWDTVIDEDKGNIAIWTDALKDCDVAICTVHPPRHGFHCSVFAARCIKQGKLNTHLIPKTGTIIPDYKREFYLPDETINSSVIAIADFTRQYLVESYKIPANKAKLIYQGTDIERFRADSTKQHEAEQRYPLPAGASPILGSIGSIEPRKGHPVLFEAISILAQEALPNIHLMLVGDGPDEEKMRTLAAELGIDNNVSFFPFTSEPTYIFERIDMTVLPSLNKEGLPNVLLESMAMGVPVVSSNIGGVPEIVVDGRTGYMVPPGDSAQLADAIKKLWSEKAAYMQMQIDTRQLMEENFDKQRQFDRFFEYFEELGGG